MNFSLTGASAGITNLRAKLVVAQISSAIKGTADDESDEDGDETDFLFKYRPGQKLYAYRWQTRARPRERIGSAPIWATPSFMKSTCRSAPTAVRGDHDPVI